jgi:trigger factor
VVEAATVTDTDGTVIDTSEFFGSAEEQDDTDGDDE